MGRQQRSLQCPLRSDDEPSRGKPVRVHDFELRALVVATAFAVAVGFGCSEEEVPSTPGTDALATDSAPAPAPDRVVGAPAPPANEARPVEQPTAEQRGARIDLEKGADRIELPKVFPEDVPVPDAARATKYVTSARGRSMTTLLVDTSFDVARGFYAAELPARGWSIEMNSSAGEMVMLRASKERRTLAVAISDELGQTTIRLIEGAR